MNLGGLLYWKDPEVHWHSGQPWVRKSVVHAHLDLEILGTCWKPCELPSQAWPLNLWHCRVAHWEVFQQLMTNQNHEKTGSESRRFTEIQSPKTHAFDLRDMIESSPLKKCWVNPETFPPSRAISSERPPGTWSSQARDVIMTSGKPSGKTHGKIRRGGPFGRHRKSMGENHHF